MRKPWPLWGHFGSAVDPPCNLECRTAHHNGPKDNEIQQRVRLERLGSVGDCSIARCPGERRHRRLLVASAVPSWHIDRLDHGRSGVYDVYGGDRVHGVLHKIITIIAACLRERPAHRQPFVTKAFPFRPDPIVLIFVLTVDQGVRLVCEGILHLCFDKSFPLAPLLTSSRVGDLALRWDVSRGARRRRSVVGAEDRGVEPGPGRSGSRPVDFLRSLNGGTSVRMVDCVAAKGAAKVAAEVVADTRVSKEAEGWVVAEVLPMVLPSKFCYR